MTATKPALDLPKLWQPFPSTYNQRPHPLSTPYGLTPTTNNSTNGYPGDPTAVTFPSL